eukprot:COSAG05_NODE_1584_length_4486_cov_402.617506_6_plen_129_part_00
MGKCRATPTSETKDLAARTIVPAGKQLQVIVRFLSRAAGTHSGCLLIRSDSATRYISTPRLPFPIQNTRAHIAPIRSSRIVLLDSENACGWRYRPILRVSLSLEVIAPMLKLGITDVTDAAHSTLFNR